MRDGILWRRVSDVTLAASLTLFAESASCDVTLVLRWFVLFLSAVHTHALISLI